MAGVHEGAPVSPVSADAPGHASGPGFSGGQGFSGPGFSGDQGFPGGQGFSGGGLPSSAASCANHPEREAIGICVKCRTRVCSECVTKVDGINYCVSCLEWLAHVDGEQKRQEAKPASPVAAALSAFGMLLLLSLMTWALVEVAMPG